MAARYRAFSLPEVLVAVALFGMAVSALLLAVNNLMIGLERVSNAPSDVAEVGFVMNRILKVQSRDVLEKGGSFALPDGNRARWNAILSKTDTLDLHGLRVDMVVGDGTAERRISVNRQVYRPSWSDPVERGVIIGKLKERLGSLSEGSGR